MTSLKHSWLAVASLAIAALMGWMVARWLLPTATEAKVEVPSLRRIDNMSKTAPKLDGSGFPTEPFQPQSSAATKTSPPERDSLQDLLDRQQALSDAALPTERGERQPNEALAKKPSETQQRQTDQRTAERERRRQAIQEMQAIALAEIGRVKAGDTQSLMAALRKFDRNMQAAGAPALIDLPNVEMAMRTAARMQELSAQLTQEAQKGKSVDAAKIKTVTDEMAKLQETMPRSFIKEDALRKTMQP